MDGLKNINLSFTSTDSKKILSAAQKLGLNSKSLRGASLEILDAAIETTEFLKPGEEAQIRALGPANETNFFIVLLSLVRDSQEGAL